MTQTIIVDTEDKKSVISKDIYGHFSEHLGRCIYGGFWVGKDSPIPNVHGYRKDVLKAFRDIAIPNLRWPGGCFADEYHWKDGIGPQSGRKRMINTNWGGVIEDNSFGTHEFMGLCDELGCKPYICGNVGSGSVQEMDEWVEYMTFSGESPMAKLRAQNGHPGAWKLPLFGVGNESWGCGGNMRPEYYADTYRRYQSFVRQYGSDKIQKIACGPSGSDYNWTEVLMREAGRFMDGLSLHYYTFEIDWAHQCSATEFTEEGWYRTLKNTFVLDELLRRHGEIMDKYDPEKRVALVVDEWGCWHKCEPGTNPGFLYQQNTIRDALVAAIGLNIFNNHADRVKIANIAQAVNVLQSPVLTEGDKIVLTPTWHVFRLFKGHQDATLLGTSFAAPSAGIAEKQLLVPGISVSASVKKDDASGTDCYLVTIANADAQASKHLEIGFARLQGSIGGASAEVVSGEAMNSMNTFSNGDAVTAQALSVQVSDGQTVALDIPAHAVAAVTVRV